MLETSTIGVEAFSKVPVSTTSEDCLGFGLDVASLYLGGGVCLFKARISSIEENSLQPRLWRLIESCGLNASLGLFFFGLWDRLLVRSGILTRDRLHDRLGGAGML